MGLKGPITKRGVGSIRRLNLIKEERGAKEKWVRAQALGYRANLKETNGRGNNFPELGGEKKNAPQVGKCLINNGQKTKTKTGGK